MFMVWFDCWLGLFVVVVFVLVVFGFGVGLEGYV